MIKINAIGLGPGLQSDLTLSAVNYIEDKNPNYLRTEEHPSVSYFHENGIEYKSFDYIYETAEDFDQLYQDIVTELKRLARSYGEINYFVPGHPLVAEKTVQFLLEDSEVEVNIVAGLSFIEPVLASVKKDPVDGFKLLNATDILYRDIDIHSDLLITQTYSQKVLSDVKLLLSDFYGDEHIVYLIDKAGIEGEESVLEIELYKLDRLDVESLLSSVYVPKVKNERELYDLNDVFELVSTLRGEDGCPWDREQDHKSLRQCVIEEAYELVEAIDEDNPEHIMEELGDVLFQAIFHSRIAYENGDFTPIEMTSYLVNKIITRHPHVFLQKNVAKSSDIVYNWNEIKYKDRNITTLNEKLENIPKLPSLNRAYKVQEKAAEVGFDWEDLRGPLDKLDEEIEELKEAINQEDSQNIEHELGDVLFSLVNVSRFLKVDPEVALSGTIKKFIKRLYKMELNAVKLGIVFKEMTLEELDTLWNEAKLDE